MSKTGAVLVLLTYWVGAVLVLLLVVLLMFNIGVVLLLVAPALLLILNVGAHLLNLLVVQNLQVQAVKVLVVPPAM